MYSYAQNFEDVYILRAFKGLTDGFYIDIGAYDPDEDSVTKALYDLGWYGVNIEPGPSFDRFVKSRPRDINLQCAIGLTPGRVSFYYHPTDPGTSTLTPNLHAKLVGRIDERREIEVEARTLTSLLEEFGTDRTIHVLKIDIEGLEAPVISSVDWSKHRPILIITEATRPYTNERIDEGWTPLLQMFGYRLVFFDGINTYYLREENAELSSAFLAPINVLDGFRKWDPSAAPAAPPSNPVIETSRPVKELLQQPSAPSESGALAATDPSELDALKRQVLFWQESAERLTERLGALSEKEKWAERVQKDLERADAFGKSAIAEIETTKTSLQELGEERDALRRELAELSASLAQSQEREALTQTEFVTSTQALSVEIEATKTSLQVLGEERDALRRELADLSASLAQSQEREALTQNDLRAAEAKSDLAMNLVSQTHEQYRQDLNSAIATALDQVRSVESDVQQKILDIEALKAANAELKLANSDLSSAKDLLERDLASQILKAQSAQQKAENRAELLFAKLQETRTEAEDFEGALLEITQRFQQLIGADAEVWAPPNLGHNDRRQPSELLDTASAAIATVMKELERLREAARELELSKRVTEELSATISAFEGRLERAYQEQSLIADAVQEEANREIESLTHQLETVRHESAWRKQRLEEVQGRLNGELSAAQARVEELISSSLAAGIEQEKLKQEAQASENLLLWELQQRTELADRLKAQQVNLFQNLKLSDGPVAIKMVLPLARFIRFFSQLFRRG